MHFDYLPASPRDSSLTSWHSAAVLEQQIQNFLPAGLCWLRTVVWLQLKAPCWEWLVSGGRQGTIGFPIKMNLLYTEAEEILFQYTSVLRNEDIFALFFFIIFLLLFD